MWQRRACAEWTLITGQIAYRGTWAVAKAKRNTELNEREYQVEPQVQRSRH